MAKNLVQMSVNGVLYDIRDQRMTTKLDYIHASLTQALEHKQDLATAVVTDNDSVNWIGRLTSGSTSSVTRYKDDYIETITGPADTHIHSLWFSMGPISYDPADKDNKELEQQRAWSKSFGVEFQELTKRPRILGLDDKDQRAEVNIYGKSLHTEYIDSPLGINYIHPDKVETIEHNIIGLPHSIPELDCLQWLYYGKRDNETNTTPLLENINIIGNASAITNIALWDFFQKEDNSYYRVLSEERIANKRVNKDKKSSNAYKIVTLDENGIIPDIFLGELKSNPLNIGNVQLADTNSQFIIRNDNVTGDNFVIAIQPSDTDTDTTKLTQTTINTKNITASNITVSDTTETKILQVDEDASITGKVSADNAEITNGLSAGSISTKGKVSAGSTEITNGLSAGSISTKGAVSAGSAKVTGKVSAGNTEITNGLSAGSISTKGAVSAGSISTKGKVSAGSATIANLITNTAVSSTKAVGYDNTGKLIPINGVTDNATNITSILTGLSAVNTDTSSIYYKLMELIYPVGSLYWSSKSTNPSSLFGGTWVQIKDRFVLACGDTYTSSGATGGASSVTLSVNNMPSHTHSFTPSGTITMNAHSHGLNNHTHSFTPSGAVTTIVDPHSHSISHIHNFNTTTEGMSTNSRGTIGRFQVDYSNSSDINGCFSMTNKGSGKTDGDHGHDTCASITIDVSHTHKIYGSTLQPTSSDSGSTTATATSSFTGTTDDTGGSSENTTSVTSSGLFTGSAGTTGSNGSGTAFSILPPYVVKYCWERTA